MSKRNAKEVGGWVYALSNDEIPGILKIGMTEGSPQKRASEVSTGTVPQIKFMRWSVFSSRVALRKKLGGWSAAQFYGVICE
jgi:hypothetical protein